MPSATEVYIKPPIERVLRERAETGRAVAGPPKREQVFEAGGVRYRADFACPLRGGGWLIIEDDDAQRALGNLSKYWLWASEQEAEEPLCVVLLVGPGSAQRRLSRFVAAKASADLPHLRFELVDVEDWQGQGWLPQLESALDRLGV